MIKVIDPERVREWERQAVRERERQAVGERIICGAVKLVWWGILVGVGYTIGGAA